MDHTWILDEETAEEERSSLTDPLASKKWPKYESAVTSDPFYHPKPKRIEKLSGTSYPEGTYRFRDDPLRVVYYPDKTTNTVFTLGAGTSTDIKYKRRSHKVKK